MKPHEETWRSVPILTKREPRWGIAIRDDAVVLGFVVETYAIQRSVAKAAEKMPARVKLAAAAPAMARVLLMVEWEGRQDYCGDGGYGCCSCCGGIAPDNERMMDAVDDLKTGKTVVGHRVDCELAGVLRAAGVIE